MAASYEGHCEMLEAIFGSGGDSKSKPRAAEVRPLTPAAFDLMFSNDNRVEH